MLDTPSKQPSAETIGQGEKDFLELRKLAVEVQEAEFRASTLEEQRRLDRGKAQAELRKLRQEVSEKLLLNEHTRAMNALELARADLEVKEKQNARKYALPPAVWDILKYFVAVVPVVATLIGLYVTYEKDTHAARHQAELDAKFKVDTQIIELIKRLGDNKNQADALNAALLLPAYGKGIIRIVISHLLLPHPPSFHPHLVGALIEVISAQPKADQSEVADEIIQRIIDQTGAVVTSYLAQPSDSLRQSQLTTHARALEQLARQCAPACKSVQGALRIYKPPIQEWTSQLAKPELSKDLDTPAAASLQKDLEAMKRVLTLTTEIDRSERSHEITFFQPL